MLSLVPGSPADIHDWLMVILVWLLAIHRYPNGPQPHQWVVRWLLPIAAGCAGWLVLGVPIQDIFNPLPAFPPQPQRGAEWPVGVALMVSVAWTLQYRSWCVRRSSSTRGNAVWGLLWGELLSGLVIAKVLAVVIATSHHHRGDWSGDLKSSTIGLVYAVAVLVLIGVSNNLIRGLLSRYQVLPAKVATEGATTSRVVETMQAATKVVDTQEIERGKVIGNIERILVLIFISHNNFEALGFLMAAKGLIRSKEFEDRDRAEYILIGSLASALIAVVVSLSAQALLKLL